MRTLNELYRILKEKGETSRFICIRIEFLIDLEIISTPEYYTLINHFKSQKPTKELHSEFYYNESFEGGAAWWNTFGDGIKQRKLFIDKMIKITE